MSHDQMHNKKISIIVPVYNEEKNIALLYDRLQRICDEHCANYEIIFVNDGSTDGSGELLNILARDDTRVNVVEFSRNFGKELATTAGIRECAGDACIMIDADLQHPPDLIPEFLAQWKQGAEVVVGVRNKKEGEKISKRIGAYLFYALINKISETPVKPNATDFRLLDRVVIDEFNKLTEKNRLTRGLIDWLGFRRAYIYFDAAPRAGGEASYSFVRLVRLAFNSIVSLSLLPLRIAGYLGIIIVLFAGVAGSTIFIGKYIFHNAYFSSFTGTAQLAILLVFFVGVILSCLGLIALYIANIHKEVVDRPMYVIRKKS